MQHRELYSFLVSFLAIFLDTHSADLVYSECDRSKTGSDKFYEFKYNDLKGEENYEELNALLDEYGGDDSCSLKVIAFPSGQFHNQEPDKPEELLEILKFVRPGKGFIPNMDFSTKVDVNGKDESPIFTWLKDMCPRPSDIISGDGDINWRPLKVSDVRWNFEKFLVDHHGKAVRRYLHFTMPMEMKIEIQAAIKNCSDEQRGSAGQILNSNDLKNTSNDSKNTETPKYSSKTSSTDQKTSNGEKSADQKTPEEQAVTGEAPKPTEQSVLESQIQNQSPKMEEGQIQNQYTNQTKTEIMLPQQSKRGLRDQYTRRLLKQGSIKNARGE